jgi:hypothetical protein
VSRARILDFAATSLNVAILLVKCLPALLFWLVTAGAVRISICDGENPSFFRDEAVSLPGWSRNELVWVVTRRFMVSS